MPETTILRSALVGNEVRDLTLSGGKIASIDSAGAVGRAHVEHDLEGRLLLPGFVNSHAHLDKALLIDTATQDARFEGGILTSPLREAKRRFTVDDVKARASRVLDHAIATGTTALRTHVDVDPYARLIGITAMRELKRIYRDRIDLQIVPFPQEGLESEEHVELMHEALKAGADAVGGKPSADQDPARHLDIVFALAAAYDLDIDIHADVDLDPRPESWSALAWDDYPGLECACAARKAIELAYVGRVTLGHVMALDGLPPASRTAVISLLREAQASIITAPSASLFLEGRSDPLNARRGITRVVELLAANVPVAYASDNTGDAFNLYSSADMLIHGLLTAISCGMRTVADLDTVLRMGTETPAQIMRLPDYGLRPDSPADLVVLEAESLYEAFTRVVPRTHVFKRGVLVAGST